MYAISDPGAFQGYTSEGLDINDGGAVVGVLTPVGPGNKRAFVWKSSLTMLSTLGFGTEARAINSHGDIAGTSENQPGRLCAVVWNSAGALTRLAEPEEAVASFTHGIDNDGHVVGGFIQRGPSERPLLWVNLHSPTAAPTPVPLPASEIWSEALGVGGTPLRVCGTSSDGLQRNRAFVWEVGKNAVDFLQGESAVRIVHSDIFGTAQSQPAYWTGGTVTPTPLPGVGNIATGIADDATGLDEVVGTVSIESIPSTARPFLRRRFRRDELDPNSPILLPKLLQLPASETIDLNGLLPPNSGWTLLTATAINAGGQITGMGLVGGQPRAYRLSPPVFESPLRKVLTKAEVLTIFGGVAAGGGGFGITPGGQIVPIPPPRPDAITVEHLTALVKESLHELSVEARKSGNEAMFRSVVQALVREASTLLHDR